MMWKEFEQIAGYEVTYEDYTNIIEPMYMATDMSKYDFVKCIDKKRFALKTEAQIIKDMKKVAEEIFEEVEHTGAYELKDKLRKMVNDYAKRFGWENWYANDMHTVIGTYRGCSFPVQIVFYDDKHETKINLMPKLIKEYGWEYQIAM